jgi:O-antigen/teichoic acid export membrane protein
MVILNVGTLVSKIGLDKAVRKFVPEYRNDGEKGKLAGLLVACLGIPFCIGGLLAVGLYLGSGLVADLTSESFGATTKLFLVGIPFMAAMTVGRAATTGFMRTRYAVYIKDIGQSGSAIVLVLLGSVVVGTTEAAILGYTISLVLSALLAVYYLYELGGFDGIPAIQFESRRLLAYSLPLTAAAVSQYLTSWTDVLMLGAFSTASAIGQYQAAFQTAMILGFLLVAANSIFPSVAADLYDAGNIDRLRDMYAVLTKWITYLTTLGYVFVLLYATEIMRLFGAEFVGAEAVLIILAGVYTLTTAAGPAGYLLMMADYERVELLNTLASGSVNVVLNFVLIQEFGVMGAAVATGLSLAVLNVLRLGETWFYLNIRPRIGSYWKGGIAIVIATPVMFVGHYLPIHYLPSFLIGGALGLTTFLTVAYLFGIDSKDQLLVESLT